MVLVLCSSLCMKPNVFFLKVVSKLHLLLFAYIVLALLRLGKPNIFLCKVLFDNDNDNDNELFIQTKSNEKHHKGNINNKYKNINIATFVPRRLHLKTSWPLAYNHL